jgi:glutathione S-transferase
VPAIDHDGLILFESGAILAYLAEQSGRLMPTSAAERAKALQWAFAALDTVETPLTEIAAIDLFDADVEWAKQRRPALVTMARDRLAVLDRVLTDKSYLSGDQFIYSDILMATSLRQIQHTDLLETFPNVTSCFWERMSRPSSNGKKVVGLPEYIASQPSSSSWATTRYRNPGLLPSDG